MPRSYHRPPIVQTDSFIDSTNVRLTKLEQAEATREGERGLLVAMLKSPLVGWIVAAALFFVAWIKGARP
jgi:hypothetical protein